ncbi:MAG: MurT ligase domain-containing protein [Heliobacteriaceae bacterium]|jgi:UDP-N-acetylmuramyl tripeptide synthase|nr:MurT ligase domain-containing protein [Heliobacteriaceae bacterium]
MGKIKFYTALIAARIIYLGIKLLNKSAGTSFVGMTVLKICPDFLGYCSKYIKKKNITVTGTNGKTTTAGLAAHILKTASQSVINNVKGANMLTGIANVFALNLRPLRRFDYSVIECDEAYLTKLYDYIKSDYLIVTNLFRDQLDRYGELDTTAKLIKDAIKKNPDLKLILNADDPLVADFGSLAEHVYYGLENSADYTAEVKVYDDYSELKVTHCAETFDFKISLQGRYNAYNALAAIAFAFENGLSQQEIQKAFDTYKSIFGRTEKRIINGHPAVIQLIKNPAGASEVLKTVDLNSNIVIAINDNFADGRDVSWLWDAEFERIKDARKLVVTSGTRAGDMAVRLKYAGIPPEKIIIEPSIRKAVEIAAKACNNDKITILPSYTVLLKLQQLKG